MAYLFDTNIWIDLDWRKIPRDLFPGLWLKVEEEIAGDRIFVVDLVFDEIHATQKDDDRLAPWMTAMRKKKPTFVLDSTEEVQKIARLLINAHKIKSNADPFLVAAGKKYGYTIVSAENRMKPIEKPKIPNLCDQLGVPCMTLLEFIKANGWVF